MTKQHHSLGDVELSGPEMDIEDSRCSAIEVQESGGRYFSEAWENNRAY